jgi:hypothetical protein
MCAMKEFLELLTALLTPVIAVVATMIAIFQYRTERQRWRLDMFDKRYPIYLATMNYIASVVQKGDMTDQDLQKFNLDTRDGSLLFGSEVEHYLHLLRTRGVDLRTHGKLMEPLPVGDVRSEHAQKICDLNIWFGDQFTEARRIFSQYIQITEK